MPASDPVLTFDRRLAQEVVSSSERTRLMSEPGFGDVHTDHMVLVDWTKTDGWHSARIVAYAPLQLDPATAVLHYGHSVFEGMKAFRQVDGGIAIFRAFDHARRFRRSAHRLGLPELPEETFIAALETLVREDHAWVPSAAAHSLYLRPLLFGSHVGIGFRPTWQAQFMLIACPVAPFFAGTKAVSVWICEEYSRAAPGGTGDVKCGGNYAAAILAESDAAKNDCDEVVWLDAVERRWVEELGGMNLFFVLGAGEGAKLLTPALTGTILPGNTRDALLKLASDLGIQAEEGRLSVEDWQAGANSGLITEVFACGTAAVVTPVGSVKSSSGAWTMGTGAPGPVTLKLRQALLDVQYGRAHDSHQWMHRLAGIPAQPNR